MKHATVDSPNPETDAPIDASCACRFCGTELTHTFVDLGMSPLCESFVPADRANEMEPFYPLHAYVCDECFLVQLQEYVSGEEIFGAGDYAYYSSYSDSWLAHCRQYVEMIIDKLHLTERSHVMEIASNDGYLLQYFLEREIPCTGIEPASNCAEVAESKGIRTLVEYFTSEVARKMVATGQQADLLLGNNVLAHVPDLNDFVAGMKTLLAPHGVITMEFPHLLKLMRENQFDTIYHEHFCYFSFMTVCRVFKAHGLVIYDVDQLQTHGGSLRIYARHANDESREVSGAVTKLAEVEKAAGLDSIAAYRDFAEQVRETKRKLLDFLIEARRAGKTVVGYGAPGKGNTLLNYCGIRTDFIDYTVDRNPFKHGKFLPGSRIPVFAPDRIGETKPDYVLILPWNLRDEIMQQLDYVRQWGAKFVIPIPELEVIA